MQIVNSAILIPEDSNSMNYLRMFILKTKIKLFKEKKHIYMPIFRKKPE